MGKRKEIGIIKVNGKSERAFIIGLEDELFIVEFESRGIVEHWDFEDLDQCVNGLDFEELMDMF